MLLTLYTVTAGTSSVSKPALVLFPSVPWDQDTPGKHGCLAASMVSVVLLVAVIVFDVDVACLGIQG